ncbi:hypothetical protein [Streptacidiphilus rugosus]|uniref:hypothetical protein n=1 Tax=Streptacidiphilus rugosus TaxID=405783 RepID=UPI0005641B87|nr:hypothetical protein [Streptacidiphilus rugosus]
METTALAAGDVRWVFPDAESPGELLALLGQASTRIEKLAERLGVRPGWTGSGLEFHHGHVEAEASLFGCAEVVDVSFVVALDRGRGSEPGPGVARRWELDATVSVRCDHVADCGTHTIERKTASFDAELHAARGLAEAAAWLLERGIAEAPDSWRGRSVED